VILERGTVLAIDEHCVWVRVLRKSACGSCGSQSECGTSVIDRLMGARGTEIRVRRDMSDAVAIGDDVEIGIADDAVLKASAIGYGLPLLGLVVGSVVGSGLDISGSDTYSMLGGFAGLFGGWICARLVGHSAMSSSEPRLVSVVSRELKATNLL